MKEVGSLAMPQAVYNLLKGLDQNSRRRFRVWYFVVGYVTVSMLDAFSKLSYWKHGQKMIYVEEGQELHQAHRAVGLIGREMDWVSLEELRRRGRRQLFRGKWKYLLVDFTIIAWHNGVADELLKKGWSERV